MFCSCFGSDAFVVIVLSDIPKQNEERGLVDRKLVKAFPLTPSNFIAGRPSAALLFWFLVILDVAFFVIYGYSRYI